MEQKIEGARNQVLCLLDEKLYPRPVVVQAAYRFIDRCYIKLERSGKRVGVRLKGKNKLSVKKLQALADDFANELLHQLAREQVAERTDKLRELLVERALRSAEPLAAPADVPSVPEGEAASIDADVDYLEDPLGIAIPWEEKYGQEEDHKTPKEKS